MPHSASKPSRLDFGDQMAELQRRLSAEAPDALDRLAALADAALTEGNLALAAACAGTVVLVEHVQAARHQHTSHMLGVLAATGPGVADTGIGGVLAWAGATVAREYNVLSGWPRADIDLLLERAQRSPADIALALGCALGEACERNGLDAEFATLQAHLAGRELQADASPFWRGYWAITSAWHLYAFGRCDEALQRLEIAQALAATHALRGLGATAALQRARVIESERDPALAVRLADAAVADGDPSRTPLWFADQADVHCRIALRAGDFHTAVGHARRAMGFVQAAGVWPGYRTPYRLNEAYALLGAGSVDEAVDRFNALKETSLPPYLVERVRCLVDLAALSRTDLRDDWNETALAQLADVLRRLRELEWPSALPLLPKTMARLLSRALANDIEVDWVCATIRSRYLAAPHGAPQAWPWAAVVCVLGDFQVSTTSGPLRAGARGARKAASKSLDLLRLLAAQGHDATPVDVVAEALWPGDGREGRRKALEITVTRLRDLLGSDSTVIVSDRRVHLNPQCVWIDGQALIDRLSDCDAAAAGSSVLATALDAALALYRGPCLADSQESWASAARDRLRSRLAASLMRAQRESGVSASRWREWALRATAADPKLGILMGAC